MQNIHQTLAKKTPHAHSFVIGPAVIKHTHTPHFFAKGPSSSRDRRPYHSGAHGKAHDCAYHAQALAQDQTRRDAAPHFARRHYDPRSAVNSRPPPGRRPPGVVGESVTNALKPYAAPCVRCPSTVPAQGHLPSLRLNLCRNRSGGRLSSSASSCQRLSAVSCATRTTNATSSR